MTQRKSAENFDVSGVIARRTAEQVDNLVSEKESKKKIISCTNCLTPETEQSVKFNEDGVCNICLVAKERDEEVDWDERLAELKQIIEQYRGKYAYDAIVPFSGVRIVHGQLMSCAKNLISNCCWLRLILILEGLNILKIWKKLLDRLGVNKSP